MSTSIDGTEEAFKKANRGVMCTKQSVATETKVPTLTVTMTAEIDARNRVHAEMNTFLNKVNIPRYDTVVGNIGLVILNIIQF